MPEYLSPGVYVEETSFRAKSIEGVATSTAGFVGHCRYGPVRGQAQLITSFDEFQRYFGSIDDLQLGGAPRINYLAHAVKLFFDNGGRRVYISRLFNPPNEAGVDARRARGPREFRGNGVRFKARFPGRAGNVRVTVAGVRTGNLLTAGELRGLRPHDMVEAVPTGGRQKDRVVAVDPADQDAIVFGNLYSARLNDLGNIVLTDGAGADADLTGFDFVQKVYLNIDVESPDRRDGYEGLSTHADSDVFVGRVLRHQDPDNGIEPPADRTARIFLEVDAAPGTDNEKRQFAADLVTEMLTTPNHQQLLEDGEDGNLATPAHFTGEGEGHQARGLAALGEVEDVAVVAAPGGAALPNRDDRQAVRNALITHCETLRYRFAILSSDRDLDTAGIRDARSLHDSTYAALYYPWLVVRNPLNTIGPGRDTLQVPPDGAIAGIYARSDIERGVHKAPANEVVREALRFSRNVSRGVQDTLNPEGINCLRFFEGRSNRVWGARTISSDPEWTYLNVRRLFIFLEHSIDRGSQWAVFEPNNEQLWLKIRLTIESFLYDVWRTGALMGTTPEEAFFVRCDRTTMSQGDLDNGRLVCLIGVAPTKPAEFVIFRIGQWTADASII